MRSFALGILLFVAGSALTLAASSFLHWLGWSAVAVGAIMSVVRVAVGPPVRFRRARFP